MAGAFDVTRGILAVLLMMVASGCGSPSTQQSTEVARLIALVELQQVHWHAWETNPDDQQLLRELAVDLSRDELIGHEWNSEIVGLANLPERKATSWSASGGRKETNTAARDEFRQKALATLATGGPEFMAANADGTFRYARRVDFKASCLRCHRAFNPTPGAEPPPIPIPVLFIDLAQKKDRP